MPKNRSNGRIESYNDIRASAAQKYATFGKAQCPALGNAEVHFTSTGFNHLIYSSSRKMREKSEQIRRFDLLDRAYFVISESTTFQEYDEQMHYKKVNRRGRYIEEPTMIRCWGLVAVVRGLRIKVVIKQEGNGKKEFLSVIPAWFARSYRGIRLIENSPGKGLLAES